MPGEIGKLFDSGLTTMKYYLLCVLALRLMQWDPVLDPMRWMIVVVMGVNLIVDSHRLIRASIRS